MTNHVVKIFCVLSLSASCFCQEHAFALRVLELSYVACYVFFHFYDLVLPFMVLHYGEITGLREMC